MATSQEVTFALTGETLSQLAPAIADAGMPAFLTKLEYKCAWYGAEYVKVDQ